MRVASLRGAQHSRASGEPLPLLFLSAFCGGGSREASRARFSDARCACGISSGEDEDVLTDCPVVLPGAVDSGFLQGLALEGWLCSVRGRFCP